MDGVPVSASSAQLPARLSVCLLVESTDVPHAVLYGNAVKTGGTSACPCPCQSRGKQIGISVRNKTESTDLKDAQRDSHEAVGQAPATTTSRVYRRVATVLVVLAACSVAGVLSFAESESLLIRRTAVQDEPSVAVCLAGGLRMFELTWPSIERHLLASYSPCDLFIRAPVDADAHKITLVGRQSPYVRHVSIWLDPQVPLESSAAKKVLKTAGSPQGLQGLLQYFHLVEGCETMIAEWEKSHRQSRYTWVVRTRPDSYWTGPSVPVRTIPRRAYVTPAGSRYLGVNDRFAATTRKTATDTLTRLSAVHDLLRARISGLNSELSLLKALFVRGVKVKEVDVPFCVLSHRTSPAHLSPGIVPVVSLSEHKGPLNGAKCRPCALPLFTADVAYPQLQHLRPQFGRIRKDHKGIAVCNASGPWDQGWEVVFDKYAGAAAAEVRKSIEGRSADKCVQDFGALASSSSSPLTLLPSLLANSSFAHTTNFTYRGPPPAVLCTLARWKDWDQSLRTAVQHLRGCDSLSGYEAFGFVGVNSVVYSVPSPKLDFVLEYCLLKVLKRSLVVVGESVRKHPHVVNLWKKGHGGAVELREESLASAVKHFGHKRVDLVSLTVGDDVVMMAERLQVALQSVSVGVVSLQCSEDVVVSRDFKTATDLLREVGLILLNCRRFPALRAVLCFFMSGKERSR